MKTGYLWHPGHAWLACLRVGDGLTVVLATGVVVLLFATLWTTSRADRAIVRQGGELIAEIALTAPRRVEVVGPIGTSVIEIASGRARVLADPGPRQYCVQQGWLTRANAVAICAPNQVSLQLAGPSNSNRHDSISY
ncbi:MAG: NusG domain II-containing protein [Rhodocyclaceae bacterium]|nr:NusG domain II-containing protein [Rhodocyclaceae bacterium]MBK9624820.1 NusG domain II-containing protein [Rhodocyclaceae bacterium]MBL0076300.1 NusG domain II-containing protein [Rhodocyclaceae bacterium]MBP6110007.1 NusG domain II-containing protein [Rhodocyclaceae bacterium]MBP6279083.1 NusG domain II-containing protein [Rhodocyclaceae bacterium]